MDLYKRFPRLFRLYRKGLFYTTRALKGIDGDKVVFSCFKGRSYNDNPRFISERLHERCPGAKIVWLFNKAALERLEGTLPDYVKPVFIDSGEACREMATARVWVDNFTKDNLYQRVKGRQFYVQTWHGDRPVKKICYDVPEYSVGRRVEQDCSRVLAGSKFGERVYRTAFRFQGAYISEGCPRNDALVQNDPARVRAIREKLGVPEDAGLLLYAPTYREYGRVISRAEQMDIPRTLDCLEESTGRKWICMVRAHYKSGGIDLEAIRDRVLDVTEYEEMADLLLAADMVLTDYSTCATDYVLRDKPAIFYIADWEEYTAAHGVYFDMREAPLMTAMSQDELEALIRSLTDEGVRENCAAVREYFGCRETGRATDAACDYIIERLGGAGRHRE